MAHIASFVTAVGAVLVLLVLPVGAAMPPMSAWPVTAKAETAHYHLLLQIGPEEKMYSKADVARLHPSSGEVMAGGAMGAMGMGAGMTMMDVRHLEVHIVGRATGKAVTAARCAIRVTDAMGHSAAVPVAMMYGVKEGPADWHYGNNVSMPPGPYTIAVAVNGEQAVFRVTIPKM